MVGLSQLIIKQTCIKDLHAKCIPTLISIIKRACLLSREKKNLNDLSRETTQKAEYLSPLLFLGTWILITAHKTGKNKSSVKHRSP